MARLLATWPKVGKGSESGEPFQLERAWRAAHRAQGCCAYPRLCCKLRPARHKHARCQVLCTKPLCSMHDCFGCAPNAASKPSPWIAQGMACFATEWKPAAGVRVQHLPDPLLAVALVAVVPIEVYGLGDGGPAVEDDEVDAPVAPGQHRLPGRKPMRSLTGGLLASAAKAVQMRVSCALHVGAAGRACDHCQVSTPALDAPEAPAKVSWMRGARARARAWHSWAVMTPGDPHIKREYSSAGTLASSTLWIRVGHPYPLTCTAREWHPGADLRQRVGTPAGPRRG